MSRKTKTVDMCSGLHRTDKIATTIFSKQTNQAFSCYKEISYEQLIHSSPVVPFYCFSKKNHVLQMMIFNVSEFPVAELADIHNLQN